MINRLSLLILLLLVACASIPPTPTPVEATSMPPIRYLALGDSYTIGESVRVSERWPEQLAAQMRTSPQFAGKDIQVTTIARTGWTVDELWKGIQASPPQGTYDLVTLLIGVNDQFRGYPVDGYREDFRFMLGKAIEYAGGDADRVMVLSIPDWGFTPYAADRDTEPISQQIDLFNTVSLDETKSAGAHYVDVTIISRMGMDDFELITLDRLHPSGKMYGLWVKKVLPVVLNIFNSTQ
ncbi:MAG: SGNH/GDSL hydrolase family protein [Anaerolineales bacterium]